MHGGHSYACITDLAQGSRFILKHKTKSYLMNGKIVHCFEMMLKAFGEVSNANIRKIPMPL